VPGDGAITAMREKTRKSRGQARLLRATRCHWQTASEKMGRGIVLVKALPGPGDSDLRLRLSFKYASNCSSAAQSSRGGESERCRARPSAISSYYSSVIDKRRTASEPQLHTSKRIWESNRCGALLFLAVAIIYVSPPTDPYPAFFVSLRDTE
jgi:hypothetical protein